MKIYFLGYNSSYTTLIEYIKDLGHSVIEIDEKVKDLSNGDLIISFGYRHILSKQLIETAKRPIINLHISYLPFNRGAHPNFWSWIDGTPSGVTIHEIDSGIDTGPIIAQALIENACTDMKFSQTHSLLIKQLEDLFKENFEDIVSGLYKTSEQKGDGTYHAVKDLPKWMTNWNMLISDAIKEYCRYE